jgi:hypothetical protein
MILLTFLSVGAAHVEANPLTISFDSPPVPPFLPPNIYPPNTYNAQGVSLTSGSSPNQGYGGFGIGPSSRAISAPNIAFGADPFSTATILRGTFVLPGLPVSSSTLAKTDFLSFFVVGTRLGQTVPWSIAIYESNDPIAGRGTLLDSITGTTDRLVTFSRPGADIGSFAFTGPSFAGIDNLSFNTPTQIPEPTSMILLGTGLAGVGIAVGKRRNTQKRRAA